MANADLLKQTECLVDVLGIRTGKAILRGSAYRMLESREILEMAHSGLVEFGAHTCSHAILSGLSEADRKREIVNSIAAVERLTGVPCSLFAYPKGGRSDYGRFDVGVLRESQISVAVTTVHGPNDASVPTLEMRRYCIGAGTRLSQFKLMTHHVLWKLRN